MVHVTGVLWVLFPLLICFFKEYIYIYFGQIEFSQGIFTFHMCIAPLGDVFQNASQILPQNPLMPKLAGGLESNISLAGRGFGQFFFFVALQDGLFDSRYQ